MSQAAKKKEADTPAPPPARETYPLCVFALSDSTVDARIRKEFNDSGMEIFFARNVRELFDALARPEAFTVFIDLAFAGSAVKTIRQKSPTMKAFWVFIAGKLTPQQGSALFNAGAADILNRPVHPVQFKARARMLLSRYLKAFDMPETVTLPRGMVHRATAVAGEKKKGDGNAPGTHLHRVGDLSRDATEKEKLTIVSGERAESAQNWQMVTGDTENQGTELDAVQKGPERGPDWNHHQSDTGDRLAEGLTRLDVEEEKSSRNQRIREEAPTHTRRQGNLANDPEKARPAKAAATPEPTPERPQTPYQAPKVRVVPDSPARPATSAPAIPDSDSLEALTDSHSLLSAIRSRIVELENREWNPTSWPTDSLPPENPPQSLRGLGDISHDLQRLFRECCQRLGASRMVLLSLKPHEPYAETPMPSDIFALTSSDDSPLQNDAVKAALFPHIIVAFERRKPIYLDVALPAIVDGHERGNQWQINGQTERAAAIFPIQTRERVFAAILIQFSQKADARTRSLLDEAASFLALPVKDYGKIDFLCRIYRSK